MLLTQHSYSGPVFVLHYNNFHLIGYDRSVDELKRTGLFARRA
jgi:hypothetical protein